MTERNENLKKIYLDPTKELETRVEDLLKRLELKEKFRLLSGRRIWTTKPIKRLEIPPMGTSDGPNGVAFHSSYKRNTFFPSSICLAASWNRDLSYKYGNAVGKETRAAGRHIILAPGINIDRTPMNGRTFEYLTEDPYLNSEMAIPYVKGVQSNRIAACVKHYAANNQETNRRSVNAIIDERALHEIYLRPFGEVTRKADPWTFMACYNRVNGLYGCENDFLLKEMLRDKWGFRGLVMSDWFASRNIETTEKSINGGLSLEMPMSIRYKKRRLRKSFENNEFTLETLDEHIRRILRVMFLVGLFDLDEEIPEGMRNTKKHTDIAHQMAAEGIVLLKNKDHILPLDKSKINSMVIKGPNANKKMGKPLYGGSSAVWPPYEITAYKGLKKKCKGFVSLLESASSADVAFVVAGLDHSFGMDSEGKDKKQFSLPEAQITLINEVAEKNKNTIVILISGSPISMDGWIDNVSAVIEAWYPGMEGGNAIADVIFGDVNPSGKLPITFPQKLSDSPAHKSKKTWPGEDEVHYEEGIFVGYRHFDKEEIEPLFPFGFGLSYTSFEINELELDKTSFSGDETLKINCQVKNTGDMNGAEVVQLYISQADPPVERPPKELRGFKKVFLKAGESKKVEFTISKDDIKYYSIDNHDWAAPKGDFNVYIGNSSRDISLDGSFSYK